MAVDPIKRELLKNAFVTIADNMVLTVVRTSRSTVVKNNLDFSASICDGAGQLIAQGLSIPVHLGATMPALKGCLDYFGDDIHPGDIMISNDPYEGASHLNDVFMFKPVFVGDRRIAFMSVILHHTDMGGRVPGGNATDSTEIFQEALRTPPVKGCERGRPNDAVFRILRKNVRVPDKVMGDFRAQVASINIGEQEMLRLTEDYEVDELQTYMTDLIDYSERLTRASIASLPDGEVEFTDWNDDDGVGDQPVTFHVKLTVRGDEVLVDFTGTSPQTTGALNPNLWFTISATYAALRTALDPAIPNNAGLYRPITVICPEGTFVNPRFPAPVGARGQAGYRIRSLVLGALAQLMPGRMPACAGGSEFAIVVAGYDRVDWKPFLLLEFHNMTGHGGGPDRDGQDAGPYCLGNVANTPVEVVEAETPVLIEQYAFLPDTGGPGKFRGALGIVRQYRMLAAESTVQVRSDRQRHRPWGLFGGKGGAPGRCIKNPGNGEIRLPSKFVQTFTKEDVFRVEMPGSGGYGEPFERDPSAVIKDVVGEKMTLDHARREYGVVIDPETLRVDDAATRAERQNRRRPGNGT
jgi:N-methylhydantoinase B